MSLINLVVLSLLLFQSANAQAASLSVTPPEFEWVIVEDRESQTCQVIYRAWSSHLMCYDCGGFWVENECWCLRGDLNCDGFVDLADYAIIQAAFTQPPGES